MIANTITHSLTDIIHGGTVGSCSLKLLGGADGDCARSHVSERRMVLLLPLLAANDANSGPQTFSTVVVLSHAPQADVDIDGGQCQKEAVDHCSEQAPVELDGVLPGVMAHGLVRARVVGTQTGALYSRVLHIVQQH